MSTMERARRLALLLSSCVLLLSFVASATELDPGVLDVVSATEAVNAEIGIPSLTDMQVTSLIELQSHVSAETGVAAGSTVSSHHHHYRHHSNRHHHHHERRERDREERDQDSSSKFRFRGRESDLNKQRQSRSARERPVAMQQPSHKIEFSEAEPPSPEPLALAETHATVSSEDEVGVKGAEFGMCKTCVFVLERIKKGTNMLLPAICSEIFISFPKAYAMCHQVLNSISLNGNNVRYWLFEGCYKYEIYQAKEWVKPCPTHVMCTVLKNLSNKPFCKPLPMEDPFKDDTME